jgi:hypothetical protein
MTARDRVDHRLRGGLGALALLLLALPPAAMAHCAPSAEAGAATAQAVRRLYDAARHDDLAALEEVVTGGFYAFDGGERFTAGALIALIRDLHAKGLVFEWNVGPADVHVRCDTAWLSYVNDGSITDAAGTHPTRWLESAVLVYAQGRWRIRFFHSTRVTPKS